MLELRLAPYESWLLDLKLARDAGATLGLTLTPYDRGLLDLVLQSTQGETLTLTLAPADGNLEMNIVGGDNPPMTLELSPQGTEKLDLSFSSGMSQELVLSVTPFFKGDPGDTAIRFTSTGAIGGNRLVVQEGGDLVYATNQNVEHGRRVLGLTQNAAGEGDILSILRNGRIVEPGWNWQTDLPIFMGTNGLLTQVEPVAGEAAVSLVVGFANSPTEMFVSIKEPIVLGG